MLHLLNPARINQREAALWSVDSYMDAWAPALCGGGGGGRGGGAEWGGSGGSWCGFASKWHIDREFVPV